MTLGYTPVTDFQVADSDGILVPENVVRFQVPMTVVGTFRVEKMASAERFGEAQQLLNCGFYDGWLPIRVRIGVPEVPQIAAISPFKHQIIFFLVLMIPTEGGYEPDYVILTERVNLG